MIEVLQAKLDARSLTPSSSHALSDSHRSPSSSSFLSDELEVCSDMDIGSEYTHYEEKKASPGHSGNLYFLGGTTFTGQEETSRAKPYRCTLVCIGPNHAKHRSQWVRIFALLLLDKLPLWLGLHQHMYAVGPGEPQWGEGLPLEHTIYLTELLPYDGVAYPSSQLQFLNHVP